MTAPEPDAKDWTWVLERACPECGFDTRTIDGPETPAWVRDLAARWAGRLRTATEPGRRRTEDRWSVLEYGCHVRDVFVRAHERLTLMLAEDDPTFANWDQDRTAAEDDYAGQDARVVAGEVLEAAERYAGALDSVPVHAWDRPGRRSEGARFTVASLARYIVHDPAHHLVDVGGPLWSTPVGA